MPRALVIPLKLSVGANLRIWYRENVGRILWESGLDGNFLLAEVANANIRSFGTPEDANEIEDKVSASYDRPTLENIQVLLNRAVLTGQIAGRNGSVRYQLAFEAVAPRHLRFQINVTDAMSNASVFGVPRRRMRHFFGFGWQLTYFNQKGKLLPILVQEHGVGRGRPIVTQIVNIFANGARAIRISPAYRRRISFPAGCAPCSWRTGNTACSICGLPIISTSRTGRAG